MPKIDLNKTTLRDEVRERLRPWRGRYQEIIDATGVSRRWLATMSGSKDENPRSRQCEDVLRFIEERERKERRSR